MRVYIFDMGEVLIKRVKCLQGIAAEFGLEYGPFREDYGLYDRPLMDGYMDPDLFYRHMETKYGIEIDEELFYTHFHPLFNEATHDMADELRARGDRAVVGSNTFEPHVRYVREHFPRLEKTFDRCYYSHEMHISKADPAFWRVIRDAEGVTYDDMYFIDDREDNCLAAAGLGIHTFRYLGNDEELRSWLGLSC